MARTAGELASYLGAKLEGDPDVMLRGVAAPERAQSDDLIFVESARHVERAERSAARCAIVSSDITLTGKTLIRSREAKLAFAKAAAWLIPPVRLVEGVHPTAVIAASARLGNGVGIGPYVVIEEAVEVGDGAEIAAFCYVGRGSRIGAACRLYPGVTLYPGVKLGRGVVVHAGAVLGSDGFGYVFGEGKHWKFPQVGDTEISDEVEIGANTTVDRGSLGVTRVGRGTKLDNLVQVAHNVEIGQHSIVASQTGISGSSVIGNHVLVGGQVGIADGCHIEDEAILGAQAGIPTGKTIRRGQTVWGTPARALDKFKQQYAWFARLPELAERIRELELHISSGSSREKASGQAEG